VPLALLWFGQTEAAMLFVVVMGNSLVGSHRDRDRRAQCSADLSPRRVDHGVQAITHVVQSDPAAALPFIVSGMKQGWALPGVSLMAAEIFVTILSGFGLGQLLHYGRELNAMEQVIGIMIVIIVIGLLATKSSFRQSKGFSTDAGGRARHENRTQESAHFGANGSANHEQTRIARTAGCAIRQTREELSIGNLGGKRG